VPAHALNYDAYFRAYSTLQDVYRYDMALLAGKIIATTSLDTLLAPRLLNPPPLLNGDPLFRGYGFDVVKASTTMVGQVVAAGGDDNWGFGITDFFSPDDGTIIIEFNNDTEAWNNDTDNHFFDFTLREAMFGK